MKNQLLLMSVALAIFSLAFIQVSAQRSPKPNRSVQTAKSKEIGAVGIVVDETLSPLRVRPSLFADSIQRMRRGRKVQITGVAEDDGVKFFRIVSPPNQGWIQADAVFGRFREGDDARLAQLVYASNGFEQIELATTFFALFPQSKFRPAVLLLFGDLLEESAAKLTRDANSRLSRREMAATAAPAHSYYLNFVMLDRYRKLGIVFRFNQNRRSFHYDGESWREILKSHPTSREAPDAKKRLELLKGKLS